MSYILFWAFFFEVVIVLSIVARRKFKAVHKEEEPGGVSSSPEPDDRGWSMTLGEMKGAVSSFSLPMGWRYRSDLTVPYTRLLARFGMAICDEKHLAVPEDAENLPPETMFMSDAVRLAFGQLCGWLAEHQRGDMAETAK